MMFKIVLLFIVIQSSASIETGMFLIDFLANEDKPTIVILSHLCWSQNLKMDLIKDLSAVGIRCSDAVIIDNSYQKQTLLYFFDLECKNAGEILEEAVEDGLLKTPCRWLVMSKSVDQTSQPGYDTLLRSSLLTNTDLVLAQWYQNSTIYMTELYRPSEQHSMVTLERGWWNSSGFFDTRTHREFYRRRRNLMLKPLTMTNAVVDSNTSYEHMITQNRSLSTIQYDSSAKICWNIAKMGFEMLNATPQYTFTADCGYKLGKDKWTGIVKQFLSGEADLGTSCYITHNRLDVIDYLEVVVPVKVRFIFRQPPLSYVSNIFALPFSLGVWVATIVSLLVCGIGLFLTTKWEFTYAKSGNIPDGSWGDVMLLTMGAVCQQGCDVEPKKASGRMILLFLCAALMALYAAYSANIVVLLQASSDSIRTIQQLHDSKLMLAANDVTYNHFWLKTTNDTELHRSVYKKIAGKDGRQNYHKLEEGVEKIRQGMFAFHSMIEPVYRRIDSTFLESEKCDLVEIDYMNSLDLYQTTVKNNPHKELFQVIFKQIRESGLQAVNGKRYQVTKPKCSGSLATFGSVGFTAFYPSLVFMSYGVALSILLLLVEILVHRLTNLDRLHNNIEETYAQSPSHHEIIIN